MAAKVRRQYAGAAAQTSITSSITSGDTTVSIASTTGWPSTASVPFYVVIDPDTSVEEKCSVTISGSTLTLTRGVDGTVAAAHSSGATIYPVFTAVDADEANELASKFTAKGDIVTQGASTFTTTTVGTNNQLLKADSSAAGGVAWATYSPVITLGGDLTGSVTLTNLGSGTLTATVAANSVALGTDTTGNYVSDVTAGTGITVTHTPGEGSSAAVAIDGTVATLTGSQTLTNKTVALGSNTVSGTKAEFDTAVTDDNFAYVGTANTFTTNQIISGSTTSDLLRITQTGTGNALLVEDAANPDSTPFVVDASGRLVVGHTATIPVAGTNQPLQVHSGIGNALLARWVANASGAELRMGKSRSATVGSFSAVSATDVLGTINAYGDDGTDFTLAGSIAIRAEGTISTGVVPGRIEFGTANSSGTNTERMRIDSAGQVGIGATPSAGRALTVSKNVTGAVTSFSVLSSAIVQSDVTTSARGIQSQLGTAAASFTVPTMYHFFAAQGTFGAGSTVTTQAGFAVDSGMTGATNNFGFYGTLAAATGRWNLYMEGTAANYLAGRLGVGAALSSGAMAQVINTTAADIALIVQGAASQTGNLLSVRNSAATNLVTIGSGGAFSVTTAVTGSAPFTMNAGLSGATAAYGILVQSTIASDVTSSADGFRTGIATAAASFNLGIARHFTASNMTIGAGSTVTNQIGFYGGAMSSGTNNFAFYGDMSAASGRWNLYMNGTANNYLAENLLIGMTTVATSSSKTVHIGNGTAPSANPSNGGVLYVESGALKYRGSSGTITTIANA